MMFSNFPTTTTTSTTKPTQTTSNTFSSSQNVTKRLQMELMKMMSSKIPGVSAFPNGSNMTNWIATIEGKEGIYEGLRYKLNIQFGNDYPYKAPTVTFVTPCFHPNVDLAGNICLDILKDQWSASYNIPTILMSIQSLLNDPNTSSPLNVDASNLWENQEEYKKVLLSKYKQATLKK
ncbi:ubiquitin-conjugating enzyme e2 20 [Anaeramoeba flamelloides]|uniref:Ubiquitin-conjugating enzyme e2 20 n=1 Tax=Anaeramoeba flamelloides TaxID=1746091 RepID=A0ABQ8Y411_9EUKA|nr:ubiquitin-conjugating enzyme e2 20 [Anaeramoeba flamelloides]